MRGFFSVLEIEFFIVGRSWFFSDMALVEKAVGGEFLVRVRGVLFFRVVGRVYGFVFFFSIVRLLF